jgi:two-component system NarL family sensor kinase
VTFTASQLFGLVVGMALIGLILGAALIAASVISQRRFLRARRSFASRLITAQDEERAAIARELHDDIVQRLISTASDLRRAEGAGTSPTAVKLDRLADDLRGMARGMHPSVVDHVALHDALAELVKSIEEREGLQVDYQSEVKDEGLPVPVRLSLYRVAQEALGNVARHAGVESVQLRLYNGNSGALRLEVIDTGRGFHARTTAGGPGIGLSSMRERLEALGGTLNIISAPGQGTRVVAILPRSGGTP